MKSVRTIVAARIRSRRKSLAMTVATLAEKSGLSVRYIVSAENGQANLSLDKLSQLCSALDVTMASMVSREVRGEVDELLSQRSVVELAEIAAWLKRAYGTSRPRMVALLGVRGAGKSAVGASLASAMSVSFVELDAMIERRAQLNLAEIFALHGEAFYRRLEFEALNEVADRGEPIVLATGGGVVTDSQNFARLKDSATTVWLKASAETHWHRVIEQGDKRPMRDHPQAMAQLRQLMTERAPLYSQADHTVDTSGATVSDVVDEILQILGVTIDVG